MNDKRTRTVSEPTITRVRPGDRVSHYEILSQLGAGGMGDVFLARDNMLDREVALKFLPPHLAEDEAFKSRFLREARAAASINHPNIITIYEVWDSKGRLCIAMERVIGEPLSKMIEGKPIELESALDLIVQVCSALRAAHEHGIVHRDIKPDNVMVARSGLVKVLDFGLAKTADERDLTQAGTTLGTASYMSPEQAEGRDIDGRSDIFSTGALLFELLTGKPAFLREYLPATIYAIVHEAPPRIAEYRENLDPDLQPLVDRALHKDVGERFQSMDEFIERLNEFRGRSQIVPALRTSSHPAKLRAKSLAVLCLSNLGSEEDDYLSYGISEDLIVDLTHLGEIRVAPMRSVLKFRNSDDELSDIARKLDVDFILDGSLMKTGSKLRISSQLVDVASGKILWAERWESSQDELQEIKSELAKGVGRTLELESVERVSEVSSSTSSANAEAYELYLRANYVFNRKKESADVDIAQGLYEKALVADPRLFVAEVGVARVLMQRGKLKDAAQRLELIREGVVKDNRTVDELQLLLLLSEARTQLSQWDESRIVAREALSLAKDLNDSAGELQALQQLIDIHQHRAEFDKALYLFERVMEILRYLDDQDMAAEALKSIGAVHFRKGEYDRARTLFNEAIAIAKRRGDLILEAKCVSNNGLTFANGGSLDEALRCFERALEIYERVEYPSGKAKAYNNLALIHVTQGNYNRALDDAQRGAGIVKDLSDTGAYALALSNVARYQTILGEYEKALASAEEALKAGHRLDYPFVVNLANDSLGYCWSCMGDYEKARMYYREALDVASHSGLKREAGLAHSNIAETSFYLGELDVCKENAAKALEVSAEFGGILARIRGKAFHGAVQALVGPTSEGLTELDSALTEARALGDPRYVIVILRLLSKVYSSNRIGRDTGTNPSVYLAEARELAERFHIPHEKILCSSDSAT